MKNMARGIRMCVCVREQEIIIMYHVWYNNV